MMALGFKGLSVIADVEHLKTGSVRNVILILSPERHITFLMQQHMDDIALRGKRYITNCSP